MRLRTPRGLPGRRPVAPHGVLWDMPVQFRGVARKLPEHFQTSNFKICRIARARFVQANSRRTIAVMQLLWIILRWLCPTDPVRQGAEAAKQRLAISTRACQITKMRFRQQPRTFFKPTRARSTQRLLARICAFVTMVNDIERPARIRAERLKRERDADPLGLNQKPHLTLQAHLRVRRCASNPRRPPGSWAGIKACSGLQLQGCARLTTVPGSRLSSGRAAVCVERLQVSIRARGPRPLSIDAIHPQHTSQPHPRERDLMSPAQFRHRIPCAHALTCQQSPRPRLEAFARLHRMSMNATADK